MTIIGSATVYSIYTSQELFNGQVTIAISTDGKFLVIGKLNFAAQQPQRQRPALRRPVEHQPGRRDRALPRRRARPGADPDPVREAADGLQEHPGPGGRVHRARPAADDPDRDARRPGRRRRRSRRATLNGRGYVDVTYTVPTGQKLDDASITDLAPEFTIAVTSGPGTVTLDSTQAPIHLTRRTRTATGSSRRAPTRRRRSRSRRATARRPTARGRSSTRPPATRSPNPTSASAAFTNVDTLRPRHAVHRRRARADRRPDGRHLDARRRRRRLHAGREHHGPLPITVVGTPTQIPNTDVFRYYLTGTFPDGKIDVSFPAGAWATRRCRAPPAAARSPSSQPTASVVAPFNGPSVDVTVANGDMDLTGAGNPTTGPHYIDVVYSPPTGTSLDYSTIYTTTYPTLMIGTQSITLGAPTAIEMVTDPTSGALVATAVSQTQAQTDNVTRFRYDFTGGNWSPGHGDDHDPDLEGLGRRRRGATTLTFEVLGPTVQLVQPTNGSGIDVNTINGRTYVDVTLTVPSYAPAGSTINWAAITSGDADLHAERPGRRLGHDRHEPGRRDRQPDADERHRALLDHRRARRVRRVYATYVAGAPPLVVDLGTVTGGDGPGRGRPGRRRRSTCRSRSARSARRAATRSTRLARRLQPVHAERHGPRHGHDRPVASRRVVVGNGFTVRYHVIGSLASGGGAVVRDVRAGHVVGEAGQRRLVDGERRDTQNGTTELGEVIGGTAAPFATMGASGPTTIDIPFPIGTQGPTGPTRSTRRRSARPAPTSSRSPAPGSAPCTSSPAPRRWSATASSSATPSPASSRRPAAPST